MYLTIKDYYIPNAVKYVEKSQFISYNQNTPIKWFLNDNKISLSGPSTKFREHNLVPIYRKGKHSDLMFECLSTQDYNDLANEVKAINYLCYCHETIEDSHSMLPALKLKHHLQLKNCLPFSVSHQGSLSVITVSKMAKSLIDTGGVFPFFICDCITHPFTRTNYLNFHKGDFSVYGLLSKTNGNYKIIESEIYHQSLRESIYDWNLANYQENEKQLINKARKLIHRFKKKGNGSSSPWIIIQHLSPNFYCSLLETANQSNYKTYDRDSWKDINFLGGDTFVSLKKLEESEKLLENDIILLILSSIDHGIGYFLLRYKTLK